MSPSVVRQSAATSAGRLKASTPSLKPTTGGLSTSGSSVRIPRTATMLKTATITKVIRQPE